MDMVDMMRVCVGKLNSDFESPNSERRFPAGVVVHLLTGSKIALASMLCSFKRILFTLLIKVVLPAPIFAAIPMFMVYVWLSKNG